MLIEEITDHHCQATPLTAVKYALHGMRRCEDAITAFLDATSRFHRRPEAIEAFVEIASCYRRLEKPLEARGILEQAKDLLTRMDDEVNFQQTTRYSREQWKKHLDWLVTL